MKLGADNSHTAGDFPLTDMKIEQPLFKDTDELRGRRPENVMMDDYELPKYEHDNVPDPRTRTR